MTLDANRHPDESQLLAAVVDRNDLDEDVQVHIKTCTICSEKIKAYETALTNLGNTAKDLAPSPRRRPQLPLEKEKIGYWRPALTAAFTLALVSWGVWRFSAPPQPIDTTEAPTVAINVWEDDSFMSEVASLTENAIPDEYRELLNVFDLSENGDSMPVEEDDIETQSNLTEPAIKGIPLC